MKRHLAIGVALTIAAAGFRLFLAWRLPNDDDDDGRFYAQIARNLLDHRGYSGEEEEPYVPTYARVPDIHCFLQESIRSLAAIIIPPFGSFRFRST